MDTKINGGEKIVREEEEEEEVRQRKASQT